MSSHRPGTCVALQRDYTRGSRGQPHQSATLLAWHGVGLAPTSAALRASTFATLRAVHVCSTVRFHVRRTTRRPRCTPCPTCCHVRCIARRLRRTPCRAHFHARSAPRTSCDKFCLYFFIRCEIASLAVADIGRRCPSVGFDHLPGSTRPSRCLTPGTLQCALKGHNLTVEFHSLGAECEPLARYPPSAGMPRPLLKLGGGSVEILRDVHHHEDPGTVDNQSRSRPSWRPCPLSSGGGGRPGVAGGAPPETLSIGLPSTAVPPRSGEARAGRRPMRVSRVGPWGAERAQWRRRRAGCTGGAGPRSGSPYIEACGEGRRYPESLRHRTHSRHRATRITRARNVRRRFRRA